MSAVFCLAFVFGLGRRAIFLPISYMKNLKFVYNLLNFGSKRFLFALSIEFSLVPIHFSVVLIEFSIVLLGFP